MSPTSIFHQQIFDFTNNYHSYSDQQLAEVAENLHQQFKLIPRDFDQAKTFTDIKFLMQKMRQLIKNHLLARPLTTHSIRALRAIHLKLDESALNQLLERSQLSDDQEFKYQLSSLLAEQGMTKILQKYLAHYRQLNERIKEAGPQDFLKMKANRRSRTTEKEWLKKSDFCFYRFTQDGVFYKGMELRPGDMVLSSVNLDGNGIYTTLVEPKGYAYHFGIFAIIEHHGRRYPVVVETYEIGVRLVPLHQFFCAYFNCYFEIFRLNDVPATFYAGVNHHAQELPKTVKGYNFDTEDPDHTYLACTSVATYLFKQLGLDPIATQSHYSSHPQVLNNLAAIELKTGPFLSPWDFIASPRTHCVGVWDNDQFLLNICRELCERRVDQIFKSHQLALSPAPLLYYFNSFGVQQIQKNTMLGIAIGKIVGFNKDNLPAASHKVLAIIEIFEHTMERCVRKLYRQLQSTNYLQEFQSMDQYQKMKEVEAVSATLSFRRLFKAKVI